MTRTTHRRRETVERLFAARNDEVSVEQHAAAVKRALDASFHADVDQLAGELSGSGSASDRAVTVTDLVRAAGGDTLSAFARYRLHREATRRSIGGFFLGLVDMGVYLAVLVLVLAAIVAVYGVFVFPQFEMLFKTAGVAPPALTAGLFGSPVVSWVSVLLVALLLFLAWRFAIRIRDGLCESQPLDRRWARLPLVGEVVARHASLLRMQWLDTLIAGNVDLAAARVAVAERLGGLDPASLPVQSLEGASKVGVLESELRAQIEFAEEDLFDSLIRARRLVANALRFLVYAGIGLFVVSMYLPIFQTGALV